MSGDRSVRARLRPVAAVVIAGALLLGACSSDGDGEAASPGAGAPGSPDATTTVAGGGSGATTGGAGDTPATPVTDPGGGPGELPEAADPGMLELLDELPEEALGTEGRQVVTLGQVLQAGELGGLTRPAHGDAAAERTYLAQLYGGAVGEDSPRTVLPTPSLLSADWLSRPDEVVAELGWSAADLHWYADVASLPDPLTIVSLERSEQDLAAVLGAPTDGLWRLGPEEDLRTDLANRTAARDLGSTLRLGFRDGRLVVARSVPKARQALAPLTKTLAADPVLGALARGLDRADAYGAVLVTGTDFAVSPGVAEGPDAATAGLAQPFTGVAGGAAIEGDRRFAVLVYTHETAAAAEANAESVRTIAANGSSLTSGRTWVQWFGTPETTVDGSTLVVRLPLTDDGPTGLGYAIVAQADTLAAHR